MRPDAFLFRMRRRFLLWFTFIVEVLDDVLHDDRDSAVGGIERGVRFPKALVGEAANLSDLIGANSIGLHDAAGSVGAVRGEFPIAVGGRWGIGLRICVPLNGQLVGKAAELLSKVMSSSAPSELSLALPLLKKVPLADSESSMRRPSAVTVMSI